MRLIDDTAYSPAIRELVRETYPVALGPGHASTSHCQRVGELAQTEATLAAGPGAACCAGLYLKFDCLDASHQISQSIDSPTGSFWHGIMHRREPDYGNAGYWFRCAGAHPILDELAADAAEMGFARFDPFAFIERVAAVVPESDEAELCRKIQAREWALLFEYSYQEARAA